MLAKLHLCGPHSPLRLPTAREFIATFCYAPKIPHPFAVVSLTILPADAQSIDSESGHVPMTMLPGPWRFHTGDDPSWSNTTFDDSSWSQLAAGEPWSQLGKSIGIY